ncbi:endoglucanase [Anaerobacterium chartisolvens]|uniref:Glucanase n=1 Tax=Anaerobacterium chartisolvens TaxID=1297424 RepID=A0A369ALR3_9FIRM|nr:glycoside hydrolase family 9 protein [Anaerobacterium chartisolvens]RCX09107.1 endoglucanase [Anaerobacterium chartisolvens]
MNPTRRKFSSLITAIIMAISVLASQSAVFAADAAVAYNYGEALQKSILFYEAQRSGPISTSSIPTRFAWRGDSQLTDGQNEGLDLTGGWVDAGDNIKFGITNAYTAAMLAMGAIEYKEAYEQSGQMKWLKNQLRWINDYFVKCHSEPDVFWTQVGMTQEDHNNWIPIEVTHLVNDRTAIKLDPQNPGTEIAMGTAAAMAASSIVFRESDPAYSDILLAHAEQLYSFGDKYRGVFSDVVKKVDPQGAAAYTSWSGYNDELVWGSIWLYKAKEDKLSGSGSSYLAKAKEYYSGLGNQANQPVHKYKWAHCWDDQTYGCYVLMSQIEPQNSLYSGDAERWLNWWSVGGNEHGADGTKIEYTPGGHARLDSWGSMRYASTTALFALIYSDRISDTVKKARYHDFAVRQINYILGDNPRNASYMVGFGQNSPKHPHHRTAHSAWGQQMSNPTEHRHILYGALVGSPTSNDGFNDSIDDYVSNEVAIDYNAGFTGALARMYMEFGGNPIPDGSFPLADIPYEAKHEWPVFAGTYYNGTSGTQFTLSVENRSAWPARVSDQIKIRYYFTLDANDISDVYITPPKGYKAEGPFVWDEANKVYYFTIDLSGKYLYPGYRWEAGGPEVDFIISSKSNTWDASNDWSFKNWDKTYINGTRSYAPNIPMYEGAQEVKLSGNEPPGGDMPPKKITDLAAVYPAGQTSFGISNRIAEVRVKLTDTSGAPIAGKTVKWQNGAMLFVQKTASVTDASGTASAVYDVIIPPGDDNLEIIINEAVAASFEEDGAYLASGCNVNIYGKIQTEMKLGDVNMDGNVNSIDYALLKRYLLEGESVYIDKRLADMNADGIINSTDLILLKKKLLESE